MDSRLAAQLDALKITTKRAAGYLQGDLDQEQIELYDLAFSRAELDAAAELNKRAATDESLADLADYFTAETIASVNARLTLRPGAYGLERDNLADLSVIEPHLAPDNVARIGKSLLHRGLPEGKLDDEKSIMRTTFRQFAEEVVAPRAEDIHRNDRLVPEEILEPLKEMGCFGLSVPERYGGLKPDNYEDSLGMVVVTEELSRGSLGAAGSLITRPEIMARAIMEGGTDQQKKRWLPGIAAGDPLCAISVTEPNTGSGRCLRSATRHPRRRRLGAQRRQDLVHVCRRSRLDSGFGPHRRPCVAPPSRLVALRGRQTKPRRTRLRIRQEGGGKVTGRAIATLGYRGMHSYEMFYDDFFVPEANLIGEEEGEGKGFYYTMRGFRAGGCRRRRALAESCARHTTPPSATARNAKCSVSPFQPIRFPWRRSPRWAP